MNFELKEDIATLNTLLESVLDQHTDLICRILPNGFVLFANEAFCKHLKKTKSTVIGRKLGDFMDISQRRRLNERIEYIQHNKKPFEVEQQVNFSKGKGHWQRWCFTPIIDANHELQSIQIVATPIDTEKKLKEQLLHTQQRFEALFQNIAYPILLMDSNAKIQGFNKSSEQTFHKVFGKKPSLEASFHAFLYPEEVSRFFHDFERALQGESMSREICLYTPQNQGTWVEMTYSPITNEFGNILFVALGFVDINKQKYLEKRNLHQRIISTAFFNQVNVPFWLKDNTGRFEFVSASFVQILELDEKTLIGKRENELAKIDFKTFAKIPAYPSLPNEPFVHIQEINLGTHQKTIKTQEIPLYSDSSELIGFLGKVQETTQRTTQPNKLVSDVQRRYLDFAKYLPNGGLFIFDTDLRCQYAVGASLFSLGITPSEAFNQPFQTLFPWHAESSLEASLHQALLGEKKTLEFEYEQKYYLAQIVPITNQEAFVNSLMMVVLDISSTKVTEKILQESEYKLQSYIQNAPEGIWILSLGGKIEYINTAAQTQLGVTENHNLQGRQFTDFFRNGRNSFTWKALQSIASKNENVELSLLKTNQKRIPVLIDLAQVSPNTMLCFTRDISELKKTEKALRKAKRNAEQNAENQANFLSAMSHEIRTPMNSVIAMTHFLLQEKPKPEQIKNLNILKFSAENLLVLINDILDYNKIESGQTTFEQIDFDLKELINSITQTLSYKAANKNIDIKIEYKNQVPDIIIGDPVRMSQILTNLIDNAIKFTQKGYIKIEIQAERLDKDHFEFTFAVKDTGIGIDANKVQHIFQRFTQASQDTTRKFGGTGLGLAITKRLIELQGGEIYVESEPGVGSQFYFNLKFKKGERRNLENTNESFGQDLPINDFNLQACRILIVEDNEMNQMVVNQFLQKWNAEVDFAQNGEIAIELLEKNEYDLILMDLEMPVMNGYQTTERIRSLKGKFQHIPIIALTASAKHEVKQKVNQAGMNDYMTKPFKPNELYEVIVRNLPSQGKNTIPQSSSRAKPSAMNEKQGAINYQKVIEISGGNKAFIRKYNQLAIKVFTDFPDEYAYAILNQDFEKLRKIHHNIRATIGLLDLKDLEQEIQVGRKLLQAREIDETAVAKTIKTVKALCKAYAEYLNSYF